jgi:hypothetical protein
VYGLVLQRIIALKREGSNVDGAPTVEETLQVRADQGSLSGPYSVSRSEVSRDYGCEQMRSGRRPSILATPRPQEDEGGFPTAACD